MKTSFAFALLFTVALHATADERRPYVIHGPSESCLYSYSGDETFITCDKSVRAIDVLYKKEIAEIEEHELRDYRREQARKKREADADAALVVELAESRKKAVEDLKATNPKGWACVQNRIPPGASILDPAKRNTQACDKYFGGKKK